MLVISVRDGDETTITTPYGEIISIVTLSRGGRNNEIRLGIEAPQAYQVLRAGLRKQLLEELYQIPIFRISSDGYPVQIIADDDKKSAIQHYMKCYPDSADIQVQRVGDCYRHSWCRELEVKWFRSQILPVYLELD